MCSVLVSVHGLKNEICSCVVPLFRLMDSSAHNGIFFIFLNITRRTSAKKIFDLHKTRIFYEFYKSLKSYFIAVNPHC